MSEVMIGKTVKTGATKKNGRMLCAALIALCIVTMTMIDDAVVKMKLLMSNRNKMFRLFGRTPLIGSID
jgi:hypothetical protein